jgi:hypothetical protein
VVTVLQPVKLEPRLAAVSDVHRGPVPADDSAPLFDTLKFYLRGAGADPHERQRRSAARREEETLAVRRRLEPRVVFKRLLRWAQSVAPVRESGIRVAYVVARESGAPVQTGCVSPPALPCRWTLRAG